MGKITRIINGELVDVDEHAPVVQPNITEARANREDQRVKYRAEMLQPDDADYYKVYKKQAENLSDGLRRRFS